MNSDTVKKGFQRAPAPRPDAGLRPEPRQTSTSRSSPSPTASARSSPGHVHLDEVAEVVKQAVREAGGVPFEFNTIAVCDGIAMGHTGMKYSLASREIIADSVETMVRAHCFDGMICIPNCDKIVPGMLDGRDAAQYPDAVRLRRADGGGQDQDGKSRRSDQHLRGRRASITVGKISEAAAHRAGMRRLPHQGSCSGMFTANSMNCLCEAIGMALPGNGTILAVDPRRQDLYKQAGKQIVELVQARHPPLEIITEKSLDNALVLDMAMGGSTNTVLHTLADRQRGGHQVQPRTHQRHHRTSAPISARSRRPVPGMSKMSMPPAASARS